MTAPPPRREGVAVHDGVRLAYEVHGDTTPPHSTGAQPTVLLVHGLGYARWGWEPVVEPLARFAQVVLFDNRGIGESDVPDGPYDAATMAGDALAVLDAAGARRACSAPPCRTLMGVGELIGMRWILWGDGDRVPDHVLHAMHAFVVRGLGAVGADAADGGAG